MKGKSYYLKIVQSFSLIFIYYNFYLNTYISKNTHLETKIFVSWMYAMNKCFYFLFIIYNIYLSNYILYFYRLQNPFVLPKLIKAYLKLLSFLHFFHTHIFFHYSSLTKNA